METIDAIIFINLKHRQDKLISIEKEINKMGFNKEKIHKIDGVYNKECGHIGCGASHIKALELAKELNAKRTLILEDDFLFTINATIFDDIIKELDKISWDVFLLAAPANFVNKEKANLTNKINKIKNKCTTTPGYLVQNHYYDKLLTNFNESLIIMGEELEKYKINKHKEILELYKKNLEQDLPTWIKIGYEFQYFDLPPGARVRYGFDTFYIEKKLEGGLFRATNDFFGGDPAFNKRKTIEVFYSGDSLPDLPKLWVVTAIDHNWYKLQKVDKFYISTPLVGRQRGFISDTM
jgi:hypothetical protein